MKTLRSLALGTLAIGYGVVILAGLAIDVAKALTEPKHTLEA